jgi:multidrug transporter EmrE-like cation transporter
MSVKAIGLCLVVSAAAVESLAQLALKLGANGRALWVALGILFYGGEIVLYTLALHRLDVSVAFPLGSLCFVGVALLSRLVLGEKVGRVRACGVACILAGTVLIAL